jgi:hypothetical protein
VFAQDVVWRVRARSCSRRCTLKTEIAVADKLLTHWHSAVCFKTLLSERPDFPLNPHGIAKKHSYQLCLDVLAKADYVVLLIKQRYGDPVVLDKKERISITHREYRVDGSALLETVGEEDGRRATCPQEYRRRRSARHNSGRWGLFDARSVREGILIRARDGWCRMRPINGLQIGNVGLTSDAD